MKTFLNSLLILGLAGGVTVSTISSIQDKKTFNANSNFAFNKSNSYCYQYQYNGYSYDATSTGLWRAKGANISTENYSKIQNGSFVKLYGYKNMLYAIRTDIQSSSNTLLYWGKIQDLLYELSRSYSAGD